MKIQCIDAYEILDSRGNPTIEAKVILEDGTSSRAAVPSGASTGTKEAIELRDGDEKRYGGKGVLKACRNVTEKIAPKIKGTDVTEQEKIDRAMIELDGTKNKSKLGGNAILAVSLAVSRAAAKYSHMPLWMYIRNSLRIEGDSQNYSFPIPLFNVINGGKHSDSGLDIQEFMIVPTGIEGFNERLRAGSELYHLLKKRLIDQKYRVAVGDEGGFAPHLKSNEEALAQIAETIKESSYELGTQIRIGIDVAASEFYDRKTKKYTLKADGTVLDSDELTQLYEEWMANYPMELIEDPMSEFDWEGWTNFNVKVGSHVVNVGDDLTVTNKEIVDKANAKNACNAVLIKVNQIGTLTEAVECIKTTRKYGMKVVISHRSGETSDAFIADLAVASFAEYIKFGAPARSERVVKYNRIVKIERKINALKKIGIDD